jgi:signal transduction histidine kinase/CHASE2 domain-containing sensor protein
VSGTPRYIWLLLVLFSALLGVSPLLLAGDPLHLEGPFQDVLFAVRGATEPVDTEVTLVAIDEDALAIAPWPWPEPVLERALEAVLAQEPRLIVCTFPVPAAVIERTAGSALKIVRPREITPAPYYRRPYRVEEAAGADRGVGWLPAEPVLRRYPIRLGEGAEADTALLGVALEALGGPLGEPELSGLRAPRLERGGSSLPVELLPHGMFLRVNFVGPPFRSFGAYGLARLLSGDLAPGTLRGRVVVLGPTAIALDRGLTTPTTEDGLGMPQAEVLVHALDTALRKDRALTPVPVWVVAIALLVIIALLGFWLRQLRPIMGAVVTLVSFTLYAALALSLFRSGSLLPIAPAAIACGSVYVGLSALRAFELDACVNDVLGELNRLDKKFYMSEDNDPRGRWHRALDLASLFVEVDSLVLFRVGDDPDRLEVAATFRCLEPEIKERRRDVRRSPYKDAHSATRRVIKNDFMNSERGVASFFVPITAVNRPLGFLVANRKQDDVEGFQHDEPLLRFIAQQLGTLMYREQLAKPRALGRLGALKRMLGSDRIGRRFHRLTELAHSILEKKTLLQTTLDALPIGLAVCDLFGRVVLYNAQLSKALVDLGHALTNQTMVDLIHDITELPRDQIIAKFSGVVMGEPMELLLERKSEEGGVGRAHRFTLSAIRRRNGPVLGLCALFADVSDLKELDQVKTGLLNRVSYRAFNLLTSIQGYADLLLESEALGDDEMEFVDAIRSESDGLKEVFDSVKTMANLDLAAEGLKLAPIDLPRVVREVFEVVEVMADKDVRLKLEHPERLDLVAGDGARLREAFEAMIGYAIDNANRGTVLEVTIAAEKRFVRVDVSNRGFGLPKDVLRSVFTPGRGGEGPAAKEAGLYHARKILELHGGTARVEAEVGEGLVFHLWLPLFAKGS